MNNRNKDKKNSKNDELQPEVQNVGTSSEESRTIFFIGDVQQDTVSLAIENLVGLVERDPKKPITLVINTHGGDVYDTFALYDMIKYIPTPIFTVGLGRIMSAGCLLLACGQKGQRKIGSNARLMYHAGWDHFGGTAWEAKAQIEEFSFLERRYDELFAKETGMSLNDVAKLYNRDGPTANKYLSADEAIKLGIADELI